MTEISSFLSDWVKPDELNSLQDRKAVVYSADEGEIKDLEFGGNVTEKHEIPITFRGKDRKLTLNKTSDKAIAAVYGTDDKNWINKPILICSMNQIVSGKAIDIIYASIPTEDEVKKYGEEKSSSLNTPKPSKPVVKKKGPVIIDGISER